MPSRREKLRRFADESFDLLVIGGGINGAGIAREAALRGLRTALVEKGDFASGTSSKSSKLIHGGLRYLEHGDLGLVLEASRERDLLRRLLAPHLIRPLPFFFPVYEGGPLGLWKLRAGLLAYDLLAAFRNICRHRMAGRARACELEPELRLEGLKGGAVYYDCLTDDARLVLETVLAAEAAGAVCLNYVDLVALHKEDGRVSAATVRDLDGEGGEITLRARAVVNATGPWLDRVRALDDPTAPPLLRPTKGVHIVVPRDRIGNRHAVVLHAVADRRVLFAIPWDEQAIIGTTDTDYHGEPDAVAAEAEDVEYLLETVNFYFPRAHLAERDVLSTFAGLRPLIAGEEGAAPSEVSREEEILEAPSGLVSLGGGKLTTYRRVAIKVVDRVARRLETEHGIRVRPASGTDRQPLPGGATGDTVAFADRAARAANGIPPEAAAFLAGRYGSRFRDVLEPIATDPALGERLDPETRHLRAEARFGAASEMAVRLEDVLRRRTQVALRSPDQGAGVAEVTASLMAEALGWDARALRRRAEEYREAIDDSWRTEVPERQKA